MGQKSTRTVLEKIAREIGLIDGTEMKSPQLGYDSAPQKAASGGWLSKVFGRNASPRQEGTPGPIAPEGDKDAP
jgi:hypothetical protein